MNAKEKIVKARGQMLNIAPFWATIALSLELEECNDIPTMATNGRKLKYNTDFVDSLSMSDLQAVCAHEAAHVVFEHMFRRNERDPLGWNIAGDYAINGLIRGAFTLPQGALFASEFNNMSVEEIYAKLPVQTLKQIAKDAKGKGKDKGDPGGCGAVEDFKPGDDEARGKDGKSKGKDKDKDGKGAGEKDSPEKLKRDIKVMLAQAAQLQKGCGDLPAALKKLIGVEAEQKLDWKELLRRFVAASAKSDFTWRRPSRRLIADDIYLPSLYSEDDCGGLIVAIDTSGSCYNPGILAQFESELNAIAGCVKGDIRVVYCDTDIQRVDTFRETERPIKVEWPGGGGTDFRPVFTMIEREGLKPTALIYLTDLDGRFPDTKPAYPVLWGAVNCHGRHKRIPFGECVDFEAKEG